jgi:hypothetical protein
MDLPDLQMGQVPGHARVLAPVALKACHPSMAASRTVRVSRRLRGPRSAFPGTLPTMLKGLSAPLLSLTDNL